jgi:16S rRNA (guanine966-N2)-methyltransferase
MTGIRVIAGEAKGRKLRMVPGEQTRPISDRVKESLFNILGVDIVGSRFLDLFAGTGSVGIEALSRGADWGVFIDTNRRAVETVRHNLALTRFDARAKILQQDAFLYLSGQPEEPFDYVYMAPPQYQGLWLKALKRLDANIGWLNPDAWVVVQIHPREFESCELGNLVEFDRRQYGSTMIVFYEFPGE